MAKLLRWRACELRRAVAKKIMEELNSLSDKFRKILEDICKFNRDAEISSD
jgi:DNA polymerase III alpha subunit